MPPLRRLGAPDGVLVNATREAVPSSSLVSSTGSSAVLLSELAGLGRDAPFLSLIYTPFFPFLLCPSSHVHLLDSQLR